MTEINLTFNDSQAEIVLRVLEKSLTEGEQEVELAKDNLKRKEADLNSLRWTYAEMKYQLTGAKPINGYAALTSMRDKIYYILKKMSPLELSTSQILEEIVRYEPSLIGPGKTRGDVMSVISSNTKQMFDKQLIHRRAIEDGTLIYSIHKSDEKIKAPDFSEASQ